MSIGRSTAPRRKLARTLSPWAAPIVLLIFVLVSTMLLFAVDRVPTLAALFPNHDIVFSPYAGTHSLPLRIFILAFYVAFSSIVGASPLGRLRFFFELSLYFVLLCGFFDLINLVTYQAFGFLYSLHVVEILSGLFGFFVFSIKLLDHGSMPRRVATPEGKRFRWRALLTIVIATMLAIFASLAIDRLNLPLISDLRGVALLGGTGPGVFLFLPMLFLLLYLWGAVRALSWPAIGYAPPLTIIIPAHNEAHVIARTLAAIDAAALVYGGRRRRAGAQQLLHRRHCRLAATALTRLAHLRGRVIDVPTPGKALALNRGIAETRTDLVVRIDADTQILPDTLARALRHFARPEIGVVGGLPLAPGDGPFDRARAIEVLLKHGYYQLAYGAADCIVGVPGMFAVYRTALVRDVGGFVSGMNGEDTDVSLRIGELGHRVLNDPSAAYVSEVPRTYRHLREQRMRWFRSVYHVCARNRNYLDGWRFSVRGKIVLPFMLLNSARRAMTVPLVLFGILTYAFAFNPTSTLTATAVIAVLLGAPALIAVFAALANGRPMALLGLPEYLLFRLVRSYLTLESVLSIAFDQPARRDR